MSTSTSFANDQHGSVLIETATALACFLVLFLAIIECSRAVYSDLFVGYAARTASRYAMVRGSTWTGSTCSTTATASCDATSANVASFVQSSAPIGIDAVDDVTVTTTWPGTTPAGTPCGATSGTNSPGCTVQVTVVYNFTFIPPFSSIGAITLASTSAVAVAQ